MTICPLVASDNTVDNPLEKNMFFTGVSNSKFRAPVTPGDQLRLEIKLILDQKIIFHKMSDLWMKL